MDSDDRSAALDLARFIDASPTPFHATDEAARRLTAAGFQPLAEIDAWQPAAGAYFVQRDGFLVAWIAPPGAPAWTPFRIVGAHSDSPNLRIKPRPDHTRAGIGQWGVEVYGGVLLNSWLDRDLGLAGRVFVRGDKRPRTRLLKVDRPVIRIPQLAIHLNREVNTDGLRLNAQQHMVPMWGLEDGDGPGFQSFLARELDEEPGEIQSWDVMCHDLTPACLGGVDEEFLNAPRIDNLCSCHAGLSALIDARAKADELPAIPIVALFDHEEVGSGSHRGAQGPSLRTLLERIVLGRGSTREDYHRAIAGSVCVSADMAHATHPNYADKHDPEHHLSMNAGPAIKINCNQSYATEGETEALFQTACEMADVPFQKWVIRTDLRCGSTIGPVTAANLGVRTVDVGNPQLAMHSSREMCGSLDPGFLIQALSSFYRMA